MSVTLEPKPNPGRPRKDQNGVAGLPPDERRCVRIKRNGERCVKWAMQEQTVCDTHGGKAPQSLAKAKRTIENKRAKAAVERRVSRMIAEQGLDVDPAQMLMESAMSADALFKYWLGMCANLDLLTVGEGVDRGIVDYAPARDELDVLSVSTKERLLSLNRHGEAQIHPFVEQMNVAWKMRKDAASDCLKAGIAERKVRATESQGQDLVRRVRIFVAELERVLGQPIMARDDFPAMMRRCLLLASS